MKFKMAAHAKIMTECYHYCFYWGFIDPENIGKDTKIMCMSFLCRYMGKTNFGLNFVAGILKFKMAAYTKIPNVIFTCFIGFLGPENMGIATKTKFL